VKPAAVNKTMDDYTEEDKARMRYYYKEMVEKLKLYPQSFPLRNGIAYLEKVLGLPKTIAPIDPMKELDRLTAEKKVEIRANKSKKQRRM
jgi:hypothetical protein